MDAPKQFIQIPIPESVAPYAHDIQAFVTYMVYKLATNRHKGWADKSDVAKMIRGAEEEMEELKEAIRAKEPQFNALMEAVDVANMMLLCGIAITLNSRVEYDAIKTEKPKGK